MENIVLTGFMGTGKSTVGRRLARTLGMRFLDMDSVIEDETGLRVREIFSTHGEPRFRELEADTVRRLTSGEFGTGLVVSTGGGVVKDGKNREALRSWATVVCLTASVETILSRTSGSDSRPLLPGMDREGAVRKLLDERKEAYEDSDLVIDTTGMSVDEVVERIKGFVGKAS